MCIENPQCNDCTWSGEDMGGQVKLQCVSLCEGQEDNSNTNKERQSKCVQSLMVGDPGFTFFLPEWRKVAGHMGFYYL